MLSSVLVLTGSSLVYKVVMVFGVQLLVTIKRMTERTGQAHGWTSKDMKIPTALVLAAHAVVSQWAWSSCWPNICWRQGLASCGKALSGVYPETHKRSNTLFGTWRRVRYSQYHQVSLTEYDLPQQACKYLYFERFVRSVQIKEKSALVDSIHEVSTLL